MFKTPTYLKKGDRVALVAPAGFIEDGKPLILAEQLLISWGLKPVFGQAVLEKSGHFAGTDVQRTQDLQEALDDPNIKAIWAVRGGYGTMRILEKISFKHFQKYPKWLIGFSDITALHNILWTMNYKSIHGMMLIQLLKNPKATKKAIESLRQALFGETIAYAIPYSMWNRVGKAKGILAGGNLSLLQSLLGTPYQIQPKGKILFIEEVGEYLYRIDRLLQSLKLAGYFEGLKALLVGGFTEIKENKTPYEKTYQELILEVVEEYDYPVLFDIPAGHFSDNRALILGEKIHLNVNEFKSSLVFKNS